jgi:flagellar FliL protein
MAKKEDKKTEVKPADDDAKPKKSPLMLIIIALAALLVIGGAAAAYFIFFKAPVDEEVEVAHGEKADKKKDDHGKKKDDKEKHADEPVNVDLEPFLVNLAEPKAKRFLKVSVTLQIKNEPTKAEVEKKLANIKNDILLLLSSKTIEDIITMEGKIRLKEEMMIRITKIVGEDKVTDIFFSQFVVQ